MLTDAILAIAHHLLIFALLAVLVTEMVTVRAGLTRGQMLYLSRLDIGFGALAGLILIVGFSRVFFGLKGPAFYLDNWVFWAKITAFLIVGLLSILPTMRIIAWRRAAAASPDFTPPQDDIRLVRRFMHYEGMVFFTIPIFAALMARGYGL